MTHGISSNSNNHLALALQSFVPFFLIICKQASACPGLVNEMLPWYTDCFVVVVVSCAMVYLKEL